MTRRDDITEVERSLRLAPSCHAPTCACVVRYEPGRGTVFPIGATCDCGRDALDRLASDIYNTEEQA